METNNKLMNPLLLALTSMALAACGGGDGNQASVVFHSV